MTPVNSDAVRPANQPPDMEPTNTGATVRSGRDTSPTPLTQLTLGRRELAISHAGATYVLRVTRANKLILTKDSADAEA